eukprot:3237051-Amphidinium_carterae.1
MRLQTRRGAEVRAMGRQSPSPLGFKTTLVPKHLCGPAVLSHSLMSSQRRSKYPSGRLIQAWACQLSRPGVFGRPCRTARARSPTVTLSKCVLGGGETDGIFKCRLHTASHLDAWISSAFAPLLGLPNPSRASTCSG